MPHKPTSNPPPQTPSPKPDKGSEESAEFRPRKPGLKSSSTLQVAVASEPNGEELAAQGREELQASSAPPAPAEPQSVAVESAPVSAPGVDEAQGDLVAATGAFAASVQTITDALMLILGKFQHMHKKQEAVNQAVDGMLRKQALVNRTVNAFAVLSLMVLIAMGYLVYRVEDIAGGLHRDQVTLRHLLMRSEESKKGIADVAAQQKRTDQKVADVQKAAEGRSDIKIVADLDGGAKVVIETPEPPPPVAVDAGMPGPTPSSMPPRPKTTVEIPVKLPPSTKSRKGAPKEAPSSSQLPKPKPPRKPPPRQ